MKKRLLITSIVMMLVVAVALSTATYAWFTSNANVTASSISLKADVSTSTALGIGWANGDAGTSISSNISGTLAPMAPVALTDGTTTAGSGASDISFFTQTTKQLDSQYVFNAAGSAATPVTYGNGTVNAFYVKNLSPANKVTSIKVSAIFGENAVNVDSNAYIYTESTATSYTVGAAIYTRGGTAPSYVYTAGTVATDDFAAGTTYDATKTYYAKSGTGESESPYVYTVIDAEGLATALSTTLTAETDVSAYYTKSTTFYTRTSETKNGDDMVRVAIFRRSATGSGDDLAYTAGDYKLIGILGQTATDYAVAVIDPEKGFDKNTTYYKEVDSAKVQVAANEAYDSGTTYYTATNTAVFGSIAENGAVKNLSNHAVATEIELVTDGALGTEEQIDLMAIVWLDGTVFDDTRATNIASVSLKFNAQ